MRKSVAVKLAVDEAESCGESCVVLELIKPARGQSRFFVARSAWFDGLANDAPIWAQGLHLVGEAGPGGSFQCEW